MPLVLEEHALALLALCMPAFPNVILPQKPLALKKVLPNPL
jgi:hypothetical protein